MSMLTGVYDLPRNIYNAVNPPERNLTDVMMGREAQRPMTAREILAADPSNPSAPTIEPTPEEEGGYMAGNMAAFLLPTPAGKGPLLAAGLAGAQTALTTHLQGGTGVF
jgi:hypothetical protein